MINKRATKICLYDGQIKHLIKYINMSVMSYRDVYVIYLTNKYPVCFPYLTVSAKSDWNWKLITFRIKMNVICIHMEQANKVNI